MKLKQVRFSDIEDNRRDSWHRRLKTQPQPFRDLGSRIVSNHKYHSYQAQDSQFTQNFDSRVFQFVDPSFIKYQRSSQMPQCPQYPRYIKVSTKFEGQSRYMQDYKDSPYMQKIRVENRHILQPRRQKSEISHKPRRKQFESTTYNSLYKPFKVKIVEPRPHHSFTENKQAQPFSYKDVVDKHKINRQNRNGCPVQRFLKDNRRHRRIYYQTHKFS